MSTSVVIGIATFRRPGLLRATLEALRAEALGEPVAVIVADRDGGTETPAVVADLAALGLAATCICVREGSPAAARNALVDAASQQRPDWRWLVMLDEDDVPTSGWLRKLLAAGESSGAHFVGGPIHVPLPAGAGILARNSVFARRRQVPTGRVPALHSAQNVAIARSATQRLGLPLYRGITACPGGEAFDLFRRAADAGCVLAWCDDAVVMAPAPMDQLTTRALLRRYADTGADLARVERRYEGAPRAWRAAAKGMAGSALRVAVNALRLRWDGAAHAFLGVAHHAGRVRGLLAAGEAHPAPQERCA